MSKDKPSTARVYLPKVVLLQHEDGTLSAVHERFKDLVVPIDADKLARWLMQQLREAVSA